MAKKYIIVCGGVYSGTGKGVACASICLLLKMRGHTVQYIKFDPYLNTSASVLAPREHGEMWVTEDGGETDLDLGHIERLANIETSKRNICTSGTLYQELLTEQEKYLGTSLQVVPHLSNKIIERMESFKDVDILTVEVGGTVGDIESSHFYEAIRQFKQKLGEDVLVVLVAPILWVETIKEFKTKPLQNAVRTLQQSGIQPDILLCRTALDVPKSVLEKIYTFTNVCKECVVLAPDVSSIYEVPVELYNRHVDDVITDKLRLKRNPCRIHKYRDLIEKRKMNNFPEVNIGVFGKYDNCDEAYISLKESLHHSAIASDVNVKITWVNSEDLEEYKDQRGLHKYFENLHGVIIPGGFDKRGVEGKIKAIRYVREKKIPFLGICLGLQCSVIEFARNVCGLEDANSLEFDSNTKSPVVHFIPGQEEITKKCGTMRLGSYSCELIKDSLAFDLYGKKQITERHRHRYEVNPEFTQLYSDKGFIVSGRNLDSDLIEIMELDKKYHPFFIGTQSHPEFKSKIGNPACLFLGLVRAAFEYSQINFQT